MHEAGAQLAERGHFGLVDQLAFGLLDLFKRLFQLLRFSDELLLQLIDGDDVGRPDHQFGRGKRLGEKIGRAGLERLELKVFVRARGEDDDRGRLIAGNLAYLPHDFDAVHVGHHEVEEDEVEIVRAGEVERLGAVAGLADAVAVLQLRAEEAPHVGFIIDDEDAGHSLAGPWRGTVRGRIGLGQNMGGKKLGPAVEAAQPCFVLLVGGGFG